MKFTGLLALAFATTSLATPTLVRRDASDVISGIAAKVSALDSAVTSYNGGDPSAVKSASDDLVSTINQGVSTVESGPNLSNSDALALTGPVQNLIDDVESLVDKLISKKSLVEKACAGEQVKNSLGEQYTAADKLAKAISAKVPPAIEEIAAELSAGITNAIQKGVDAYKDVKDGADCGGSGSTTSSATATATATETETKTATETETETATSTSSVPVIPTGGPTGSASATPTSNPTRSGTPAPPDFTGAASKQGFSLVGGALAAVAVAVAI